MQSKHFVYGLMRLKVLSLMFTYVQCRVPWEKIPAKRIYVLEGTKAEIHWSYSFRKDEVFLYSILHFNMARVLASRDGIEDIYTMHLNESSTFSISGKDNVVFIIREAMTNHVGHYCLAVTWDSNRDRFTKMSCTYLNLYGDGQVNTELILLSPNDSFAILNKPLVTRCITNATPPPTRYYWESNGMSYSSTNDTITCNAENAKDLTISCTPRNEYGQVGPTAKIKQLPVYDPPSFPTGLCTRYNMTTKSITIRSSVTGYPKPNLSLINASTGEVVSNKGYFEVPYMNGVNIVLTYYWRACNKLGCVNSAKVLVMTDHKPNDHKTTGGEEKGLTTEWKVGIVVIIFVGIIGIVIYVVYKRVNAAVPVHKNVKVEVHPKGDMLESVDPGYELNEINEDGHQGNVNAAVPEQKTVELEVRPEEDMQENDITGSSFTRTAESLGSPRSVPQLIETKQIQEPTTSNDYSQYDEEDNQYYRNLARQGNPEQQSLLEDSQGESSFSTLSSAVSSLLDYHTEKLS